VNQAALVAQQEGLNTGFMRLAEWMSTHPPLAARLVELNPALATVRVHRARGTRRACAIVGTVVLPFVIAGSVAVMFAPRWFQTLQQQQLAAAAASEDPLQERYEAPPRDIADARVTEDLQILAAFLQEEAAMGRTLPLNGRELYKRWNQVRPYEFSPFDPFDGERYGYETDAAAFVLWSSGPDAASDTEDDIYFDSRRSGRGIGRRPLLKASPEMDRSDG
jgi:hypothetical protein